MSEQPQIPNPQESDSDEIRWALETARSLWANDAREALRWLRRAAETASDVGDDMRSVQLARAAADLRSAANIQGSLPPPASAAPPPVQAEVQPTPANPPAAGDAPPAEHVAGMLAGQSATSTPVWSPQSAPEPQTVPTASEASPAAPLEAEDAAVTPAGAAPRAGGQPPPLPPDFGAPPPARSASGPSLAARAAAPVAAVALPAHPPEPEPAVAETAAAVAAAVEQPERPAEVAPAAEPDPPAMFEAEPTLVEQSPAPAGPSPSSSEAPLPGFVSHQALRVTFNPQSDEFGQLLVRPLIEGEVAPAGWVTALLVGLESGNVVLAGAE